MDTYTVKEVAKMMNTSEETVRRAKSQLGMSQYSLMFNNCEHFAIWCKTGLKESSQMIRLLCDLF